MIKKLLPPPTRIFLRRLYIFLQDVIKGHYFQLVKPNAPLFKAPSQLEITQAIRKNAYSENKKWNLSLAVQTIQYRKIEANQIFSFWELVGAPTPQRSFKKGRNIVNNQLQLDTGGGLCQLSGLIFHLALVAGLEILERYPHSMDLYTEATRYTPLGTDATVVYAYKDLRFRNNLNQAISFEFAIMEGSIIGRVLSQQSIFKQNLVFENFIFDTKVEVQVYKQTKSGEKVFYFKNSYKKLNSHKIEI